MVHYQSFWSMRETLTPYDEFKLQFLRFKSFNLWLTRGWNYYQWNMSTKTLDKMKIRHVTKYTYLLIDTKQKYSYKNFIWICVNFNLTLKNNADFSDLIGELSRFRKMLYFLSDTSRHTDIFKFWLQGGGHASLNYNYLHKPWQIIY